MSGSKPSTTATRDGNLLTQYSLDSSFTESIINASGPKTNPRLRQLISSFIQHIHDFARDNDLTVEEWLRGVDMIN